jgi:hypothetical protein
MQIFVHEFYELNENRLIVHRMRKGHRFPVSPKPPPKKKVQKTLNKTTPPKAGLLSSFASRAGG